MARSVTAITNPDDRSTQLSTKLEITDMEPDRIAATSFATNKH